MFKLFHEKVGAKLILGYLSAVSLMVVAGALMIVRLVQINATLADLTQRVAVDAELSQAAVSQILAARLNAQRYITRGEQADLDAYNEAFAGLRQLLEQVRQQTTQPERAQAIEQLAGAVANYDTTFEEIVGIIRQRQHLQSTVLDVEELAITNKLTVLRVAFNISSDSQPFLAYSNAQNAYQTMRLSAERYLAQGDERHKLLFDQGYVQARAALASLETVLTNPVLRQRCQEAQSALRRYTEAFETIHSGQVRMKELSRTLLQELGPNISGAAAQVAADTQREFEAQREATRQMVTRSIVVALVAFSAALALGLLLALGISRGITRPLDQVVQTARQIADTDLPAVARELEALARGQLSAGVQLVAQPLRVIAQDEVGHTAQAFNQIIVSRDVMERSFRLVASYLNDMARAAQSIAQGDLDVTVQVRSAEDVLGNAMVSMVAGLRAAREQVERQLERLSALRRIDETITTSHDLEPALRLLVEQACRQLGVAGAEVLVLDTQAQVLQRVASYGAVPGDDGQALPLERSCAGRIARTNEPLALDLTRQLPECLAGWPGVETLRAYYGLPLRFKGEVKGVLQLFHDAPIQPEPAWQAFVETLAGQAAIAIENHQLVRGLAERVAARTAELQAQQAALGKSEQRLALHILHTPLAVIEWDADQRVTAWNPAAERIFGYTREEALGRDVVELIVSPAIRPLLGELIHDLKTNPVSRRNTNENITKDGRIIMCEWYNTPLVDQEGRVMSVASMALDVTERHQAEIALRQAKEAAEQARQLAEAATRAKSEFLANMSHEIRTPMNAIIGMTSLLLDTPLTPEQREFAETIRASGDTLLSLINDILDFSKIESGKMELEHQPFDLRTCIEEALDLVSLRAAQKGLDLAYHIEANVPGYIVSDMTRLRQILVNLLNNAVKFTEHGEVVVEVRLADGQTADGVSPETSGRTQLCVSVRDTGIGIPPEKIGRLFQSFSQVDASTTRKYGGTGLGLAISKRLAELMGGSMWVESRGVPGEGSTFYFTIAVEVAQDRRAPIWVGNVPQLAGRRVLIVDDNATNRNILGRYVASWQMVPEMAESAQQALSLLEAGEQRGEPFDLAILDLHMPDMDGVSLARTIRQRTASRSPALVMVTSLGHTLPDAKELFAAFLHKPIKPGQLREVLVAALTGQPASVERRRATDLPPDDKPGLRHPLRILLAEDNVVNQRVALRLLERLGYSADVAANGLETLDALRRQVYDVVLMDVQMPEMDGLEASRRICQEWPADQRPRLIAMTANAMQGDREACLAAGMDDYISKPVRLDELRRALSQATRREVSNRKVHLHGASDEGRTAG